MGRCCLASHGKVTRLSCVFLLYLQEHLCIEGIWAFLEPVSSIHPVLHSSLHRAVSSSTAMCSTRLRKDLLVLHPSSVPSCPQTLHGRYQTTSVPTAAFALPPHPLPKEGKPFSHIPPPSEHSCITFITSLNREDIKRLRTVKMFPLCSPIPSQGQRVRCQY